MQKIKTGVLIVGGGIGGCRAALRAKELGCDVTLVEKTRVARGAASCYAHTQLAPLGLSDQEQGEWLQEIVEASTFLADQDWVQQVLEEAEIRFRELLDWGFTYIRDTAGNLVTGSVRGAIKCRSIHIDGIKMLEDFRRLLLSSGVRLMERIMIIDLLTTDGQYPTREAVCGAVGIDTLTGEMLVFESDAVIVATGAFNNKMHTHQLDNLTGDGRMMAYRAGAELFGFEFIHTARFGCWERKFRTSGQAKLQALGAKLFNSLGERFMERYEPVWLEKAGLNSVSCAVVSENLSGRGPCYMDMRHFSEEDVQLLEKMVPDLARNFAEFGIDIRKQMVRVTPLAYLGGHRGGVMTDRDGETTVAGLFTIGAAAGATGRVTSAVAGLASTHALVSGFRAGEKAAAKAGKQGKSKPVQDQIEYLREIIYAPYQRKGGVSPFDVNYSLAKAASHPKFSFFKSEEGLIQFQRNLKDLRDSLLAQIAAPDPHELVKANETRNLVQIAELHCLAALNRKESRGALRRVDHPYRDDQNYLKWLILKMDGNQQSVCEARSIPFERYAIKPTKREIVPVDLIPVPSLNDIV